MNARTCYKSRYLLGIVLIGCWPVFNFIATMIYNQPSDVIYGGMHTPGELVKMGDSCLYYGIVIIVITEIIYQITRLLKFYFKLKASKNKSQSS